MKLTTVHLGYFKLDGGAMFGVVPKSLWSRTNPADENNMCTWSMRSLLIESDDRRILIDTGIGDKQSEKFFGHYYLHGDLGLAQGLEKVGLAAEDITDVFLTHLHFDHVGGAVKRDDSGDLKPFFPNATYWSDSNHWQWANQPNAREKASFLKENFVPLQEHDQLKFVDEGHDLPFDVLYAHGHTESQMIPVLSHQGRTIYYAADLLPSAGHLPLPYVMSYDVRPLDTLSEKKKFLDQVVEQKAVIYLEHDPEIECITLKETEKGPRLDQSFQLDEWPL